MVLVQTILLNFGIILIGNSLVSFPARSPYSTPCDYCMHDYIRGVVYSELPQRITNLKNEIGKIIATAPE